MESNWVDFKALKQSVTIEQVLGRYGIKLKRLGKELRGRCPIPQGEGTDSFHANTEKNAFHCFSCQAKGNVLDLVATLEKCSVRDAAVQLQQWFQPAAGNSERSAARALPEKEPEPELARKETAGDGGEPIKPLLFRLKGIDHTHPYLTGRGIDPETAEYFGVGFFLGKGSMHGRIVIPIENEKGELVAYAGRSIDGTDPKYKLPPGFKKSQVLYNLARALEDDSTGAVVLVEGFFDCMKVVQTADASSSFWLLSRSSGSASSISAIDSQRFSTASKRGEGGLPSLGSRRFSNSATAAETFWLFSGSSATTSPSTSTPRSLTCWAMAR